MPKFDGEGALKFLTFFTTFKELIDENKNLTTMDKFSYLKNCLTGSAAVTVNKFPTMSQFYPHAMRTLEEFYGRTTKVIQEITRDLHRTGPDKKDFREWFMKSYATLMMLTCLGRDINKYSDVLIPYFKDRIPRKMEEDWARISLKRERHGRRIKLTQFLGFIQDEILLQSDRKPDFKNKGNKSSNSQHKKKQKSTRNNGQRRMNAALFTNGGSARNDRKGQKRPSYGGRPPDRQRSGNARPASGYDGKKRYNPNYCFCCGVNPKHKIEDCKAAKHLNRKQIIILAKTHNICFRCLDSTHANKSCTAKPCGKCKGNHHELLHFTDLNQVRSLTTLLSPDEWTSLIGEDTVLNIQADSDDSDSTTDSDSCTDSSDGSDSDDSSDQDQSDDKKDDQDDGTALKTAEIKSEPILLAPNYKREPDNRGKFHYLQVVRIPLFTNTGTIHVNAILDTGAQRTFISRKVSNRLGLNGPKMKISLNTISDQTRTENARAITVNIGNAKDYFTAQCVELAKICQPTAAAPLPDEMTYLKGLKINNAYAHSDEEVGLLIGLDHYDRIVIPGRVKGKPGDPVAINTIFGWILYGETFQTKPLGKSMLTITTLMTNETDQRINDLEKL